MTTFIYGPFTIDVEHHEWDCGAGCCSTSGNTAQVREHGCEVFYYGDENQDGQYSKEEFAAKALIAYIQDRDYRIQLSRGIAENKGLYALRNEYDNVRVCLAILKNNVSNFLEDDCFGKNKRGKAAEEKATELCNWVETAFGKYVHLLRDTEIPGGMNEL